MPEFEVSVELRGTFSMLITAANAEEARTFGEALGEFVMTTEGLMDDADDVAKRLGLDVDMSEFCISGSNGPTIATEA